MHEQLAVRLRRLVATLEADARLPTEMELVQTFKVSRTTVRRAIGALVDEGSLVRRQGAGTFVAPKRVVHPLDQLRPFVSIFGHSGKYPEGTVLRFAWTEDPSDLRGLDAASGLIVRRLYTIDGHPQAMVDIALPPTIGERISRAQMEEHPVFQVLQQDLGVKLGGGDITLAGIAASAEQAKLLAVEPGSPLLTLSRVTHDVDGQIVERSMYYLLASKFELRLSVDAHGWQRFDYSFSKPGPQSASASNGRADRALTRARRSRTGRG